MTLLPDAEALLIAALKAQTSVSSLCGGRVGTRLSGTYPAIRVTLLGGPARVVENTAQPELQVECWGNGAGGDAETQASDLARNVEAAVLVLRGTYGPGTITGAWTVGLILHAPDASTSLVRERYIVTVGLTVQP